MQDYKETMDTIRNMLQDKTTTKKSIKSLQMQTGYMFVNFNRRKSDMHNCKDIQLLEKLKKAPLQDWWQESPILMLDQMEEGLFSFSNVPIAPFHCLLYGVFMDILLWFEEKNWCPKEWADWGLNIKKKVGDFKKEDLERVLEKYEKFETLLPDHMKQVTLNLFCKLKNVWFHDEDVEPEQFFAAKKDFFMKCSGKWSDFLAKPNFHNIDHLFCQVAETGPLTIKSDVVGESIHTLIKEMKDEVNRPGSVKIIADKRMQNWYIKFMDVE